MGDHGPFFLPPARSSLRAHALTLTSRHLRVRGATLTRGRPVDEKPAAVNLAPWSAE